MTDPIDPTDPQNPQDPQEPRFDPMKEIQRIGTEARRVIEQGIQQVQTLASPGSQMRLDVYEIDDTLVVRTSPLDNLVPSSIEVSMENNVLTISGETRPDAAPELASYLLQERKFGPFSRSVQINIPVKSTEAKAKLKNGSLTIQLPIDQDRDVEEIDVIGAE